MTKQEALQKIEELKQFVVDLDSREKALDHGDVVITEYHEKRIVIDTKGLQRFSSRYLVIDEKGRVQNWDDDPSNLNMNGYYIKIKNVFKD